MANVFTTFEGLIAPLVTPFAADGSIDFPTLDTLCRGLIAQDFDALMPTALTGEGPLLDEDETLAVWDTVFAQATGAVAVVPAVIATTTARAVRLAQAAAARGATALMAAPILPELYAGRSHDDVYGFYADIAAAVALPLIVFNYPSLTGVDFTPPLLERLVAIDAVRFIKESSGDVKRVPAIARSLGERLQVICGAPNTAMESLALGCRAWITGIMNAVPRSCHQLMTAVHQRSDLTLAREIYFNQILPLVDVMNHNNNPTGTIKAAVTARGIAVGAPRRPGSAPADDQTRAIADLMAAVARAEVLTARRLSAP